MNIYILFFSLPFDNWQKLGILDRNYFFDFVQQ